MLLVQTEVRTSDIPDAGRGVFLLESVAAGKVIARFDQSFDQLYVEEEVNTFPLEKQDFIRSHGRYCEAKGVWALDVDNFQFANHAEKPTLRGIGGPLGEFVAAFDLPAGTELTLFYPEICDMSRKTGLINTTKTLGGARHAAEIQKLNRQ